MKTILVAVDFSDVTLKVVKAAIYLAKPFQSKIILMHVSENPPRIMPMETTSDAGAAQTDTAEDSYPEAESLKRYRDMVESIGLECLTLQLHGSPIDTILLEAETARVDLMVLGSHSRGPLYYLFVGSVVDGIIKRAKCPVLVVPLVDFSTKV
ncbi:MAG: universal stress protein [Verrucomicrobia bacterium]|nr:universal stress protein [Verrucomicrobiota bacterium]